jgi:hypothetical protein
MKKMTMVPMQPQPDFLAPQPATTPRSTLLNMLSFDGYDLGWEQYQCQSDGRLRSRLRDDDSPRGRRPSMAQTPPRFRGRGRAELAHGPRQGAASLPRVHADRARDGDHASGDPASALSAGSMARFSRRPSTGANASSGSPWTSPS